MLSDTQATPASGFDQFSLSPTVARGVAALGFTQPTPIQAQAIPHAMAGRDVLGLAQTGTGKTAAFGLPILERLNQNRRRGPRALVIAPTRELAMQIDAELNTLGRFTGLRTTTIFGGVSAGAQIRALRENPDLIVACPGRLLDLMQQGYVKLNGIEVLVLDEADHMFDMGFLPNIRRIVAALPAERQNLLFSATMPDEVRSLTAQILRNPAVIELSPTRPAETIEHALYPVDSERKVDLLRHLLADAEFASAIVFLRTKHRAKRLAQQLERFGHRAVALQGNMSQPQRERAMEGFRSGRFDVLVATDIAARGLDIAGVSHVINFDVPNTADAYTHRIGRTGRAERSGKAFTFVASEDHAAVRDIERKLGKPIARKALPGFAASTDLAPFDDREHRQHPRGPVHAHGRPTGAAPQAPHGRFRPHAGQQRRRGSGSGASPRALS
jgi:ATP-dependent RNA helicase RhlE